MPAAIWWKHARIALAMFLVLASVLGTTAADVAVAGLFFDASRGEWIGAHNWWTNEFVHTGGRWAVRAVVLLAVAVWIAACVDRTLRPLRRPAAYFIVSVVSSVGIVGLLKTLTNVDCPWDLAAFGGDFPFVHLFADRPDRLRHGQCFPAAHASSGYALLALYFAFRERKVALARLGLVLGVTTGLVFGLSQQARGAHFVSHDLWSAFIGWMVALTLYTFVFKARLWVQPVRRVEPAWPSRDELPLAARRLVVDGSFPLRHRAGGLPGPTCR